MTKEELKAKVIEKKDEIICALYDQHEKAWKSGYTVNSVLVLVRDGDVRVCAGFFDEPLMRANLETRDRFYLIQSYCYEYGDVARDYFLDHHMHYNELMDYLYKLMDDETREVIMNHIEAEDLDLAESIEYIERDFPTLLDDCIASLWYDTEEEHMREAEKVYNDFINSL